MREDEIWIELFALVKVNSKPIFFSLILGALVSAVTVAAQLLWQHAMVFSETGWFRNLGLPVAWIGIWKTPGSLFNARFYFYWWTFLQNSLFWAVVVFASIVVYAILRGGFPLPLLPAYVVGLAFARIQLEFQMAVAARGAIFGFARIDPFSYAHIAAYFAMALLLFPAIIALASRLGFVELFRLSSLGFPVILMPPTIDYYVLKQPVVYNFFTTELYRQLGSPFGYLTILSTGIKLEVALVATMTFAYLLYRTRSILRSVAGIVTVIIAFIVVSTPALTSRLDLGFSQPQLFAGYLLITYVLIIVGFELTKPGMGSTILRRIRLRGVHFPAMALFGSFLVHPAILVSWIPVDFGLLIASTFVVYLVWQVATVFNDISDEDRKTELSGYLGYGGLIAVMAVFAAIPFGPGPLLLAFLAVCLALAYPTLRRRHWLLSGLVIGASSCLAFLFGTLVRVNSPSSAQPVGLIALAIFVIFSGGALLKDIADVEGDKRSGIQTIFTRFETRTALFIVASFVAIGFMLPAVFLHALVDGALFLAMGIASWVLIILAKDRSYKPVLILYFVEGMWVFIRLFVTGSS